MLVPFVLIKRIDISVRFFNKNLGKSQRFSYKNPVIFEVGTEAQSVEIGKIETIEYFTSKILDFCKKQGFPKPHFLVAQAGTFVQGKENIGCFNPDSKHDTAQISEIIKFLNEQQVRLKIHNADYLSDGQMKKLNNLGVHALNIAPEFAVVESLEFVNLCRKNDMKKLAEKALTVSYDSKMWEKWVANSTSYSDFDKAIIELEKKKNKLS